MSDTFEAQSKLLRLTIDTNGSLIVAQLKNSILDLTTELKSQTITLGSKIDAINTTVGAGLAKIEVVNDKINTTLDLRLTAVENKLGSNNTSLGEIKTELSNLKTAIDNVNTNITAGYTAVKGSIDDMTGQLTVKLSDNTTAIVNMENGMKDQLVALKQMIEQQGGKIVTAIGQNGDVIVAAVNSQGSVIGTAITTQGGEIKGSITGLENGMKGAITQQTTDMNLVIAGVVDAITAQTAALNTAIENGLAKVVKSNNKLKTALTTAINELKDKQDANSQAMLKQLEKMAADNGIYQDPADKTSVYMEPAMWAAVNANPELKKIISDMLEVQKPTILCNAYYLAAEGMVQNNDFITVETEKVLSTTDVVAGTLQPLELANGKKVIRIAKVPEQMNYNIKRVYPTTTKNITHIYFVDANGKSYTQPAGVSNKWLTLTTYKDGVIMSVVKCNVYLQNDAGVTGTPTYEYPE